MIGFVTLIFWACYTCSDEDDRVAFWRHDTLDVNLYLANQEFSFVLIFFSFKILHSFFIVTTSFLQAILYRFLLEKNVFWFKFKPPNNQHLKSVWLWNNFVVLFLLTHPNYRGLLAVSKIQLQTVYIATTKTTPFKTQTNNFGFCYCDVALH